MINQSQDRFCSSTDTKSPTEYREFHFNDFSGIPYGTVNRQSSNFLSDGRCGHQPSPVTGFIVSSHRSHQNISWLGPLNGFVKHQVVSGMTLDGEGRTAEPDPTADRLNGTLNKPFPAGNLVDGAVP